ncbi:hypothetical protein RAB80_014059 [Fusarium oxysporum f. sp. vasinfectum]|nr:hypothetical protein RAB80_018000 [Fusarium oxysporum f. sp. vasinfectum]KAK2669922.1 hypothetical protein RAB80_014059 [Fusarium oxysporum f. sp. vasinfectum]
MAVSSNCRAVSRTLLVGLTIRLGLFGVEKGASSCSTTISAPIGSTMTGSLHHEFSPNQR